MDWLAGKKQRKYAIMLPYAPGGVTFDIKVKLADITKHLG